MPRRLCILMILFINTCYVWGSPPRWMPLVTQAIQNHHALISLQNESAHIQAKKNATSYVPPIEIDFSLGQTTWGNSSGLTFDGGIRQMWVSDKKKLLHQTHWQLDRDQAQLNQTQKFEELRWDLVSAVAQYLILQTQLNNWNADGGNS